MNKFAIGLGALLLAAPSVMAQAEAPKTEKAPKAAKAGARREKGTAHVRVLHALVDAPAADIYLDDKKVAENIAFKTISDYLQIDSGKTNVKITANGKTDALLTGSFTATKDAHVTVAAYGTTGKAMILSQNDNTGKADEKKARVRVFHLVPDGPAVDVTTPSTRAKSGASNVLKQLAYGKSATKLMAPGKLTLQLRADGKVLKEATDVTLEAGKRYAIFAVGKPDAIELIVKPAGK